MYSDAVRTLHRDAWIKWATNACLLEFYHHFSVDLPSCQIVGHCPLAVGHVSNPVVRIDVRDAKQVEAIQSEPQTQRLMMDESRLVISQIAHANIRPLIGRGAEILCVDAAMGRAKWQSVGISQS